MIRINMLKRLGRYKVVAVAKGQPQMFIPMSEVWARSPVWQDWFSWVHLDLKDDASDSTGREYQSVEEREASVAAMARLTTGLSPAVVNPPRASTEIEVGTRVTETAGFFKGMKFMVTGNYFGTNPKFGERKLIAPKVPTPKTFKPLQPECEAAYCVTSPVNPDITYAPPRESWAVVNPTVGTFPNHPFDKETPRCAHGCVSRRETEWWCSGCRVGLVSKDVEEYREWRKTQPSEKFTQGVDSLSATGITRPKLWKRDKPWAGTPSSKCECAGCRVSTDNPSPYPLRMLHAKEKFPEVWHHMFGMGIVVGREKEMPVLDVYFPKGGRMPIHVDHLICDKEKVRTLNGGLPCLPKDEPSPKRAFWTCPDFKLPSTPLTNADFEKMTIRVALREERDAREEKEPTKEQTLAKAISDAFRRHPSMRSDSSLDRTFKGGLHFDGEGFSESEPSELQATESVTMLGDREQVIETVVLGKKLPCGVRTPSRSYFERIPTDIYPAEMLSTLRDDYKNEALSIESRIDALVTFAVGQTIIQFDLLGGSDEDATLNRRIAAFIQQQAKSYTMPNAGGFASSLDQKTIRMRLRNVTEWDVREFRERLKPYLQPESA